MTDIAHASEDDVRALLEAFSGVAWPLSRQRLGAIAGTLRWQERSSREKGVTYLTGLPYRNARADCLLRDDAVLQVDIGLSERVDDADGSLRAAVRVVEQDAIAVATAILGAPSGSGTRPRRTFWDLRGGARIAVKDIGDRVLLQVLSPFVADIERAEERLGVDPDRVVGVDPEPY